LLLLLLLFLVSAPGPTAHAESVDPRYAVSVVPSDDPALRQPTGRDQALSPDQVLAMVRRSVDLIGGMASIVPDTARLVLLKANIAIDAPARSGIVTDDRVVRAVAILVHEVAPRARILIAEGAGGWISPGLRDSLDLPDLNSPVVDGFALAGHRATVAELRAQGVDIDCYDLNFDRVYSLQPAGGGLAAPEYSIAAAVIDADVWINMPVAKTHGAKITCCMKNHFGILPGRVYGWSKANGTPRHAGMPHSPRLIDEAWIDLYGLTRVDLNVVDMIAGSQAGAFERDNTMHCNTVLAGRNPIATDLVVARLMGFNPDDFEFAELAWQRGMGPRNLDAVDTLGAAPSRLTTRWQKAGASYGRWGEWGEHANYGMGPRYWTLFGPLPADHQFSPAQLASLEPVPGQDGWSPVVYFGSDRVDLDKQLGDPVDCAAYAFTHFTMARSDSVRFWVGSDEDVTVWLDGIQIHSYAGRRRHALGMDRVRGYVAAGEHRLLVRASQTRGDFEFSINVCEPVDDELFAGNRYPGVRYWVGQPDRPEVADRVVAADDAGADLSEDSEPFYVSTLAPMDSAAVAARPATADTVRVNVDPVRGHVELLPLLVQTAGLGRTDLDSTTLRVLSTVPFTLGHLAFGREGYCPPYGPPTARLLDWLGCRYAISYGLRRRDTVKTLREWLVQGQVPVTGNLERRSERRGRGSRRGDWVAIAGLVQRGDSVSVQVVGADSARWMPVPGEWTGVFPGGLRQACPLVTAVAAGRGVLAGDLVDSVAALALDMALTPEVALEAADWGTPTAPAGLRAWDQWVIDWERLPLTPEWALQPDVLDRLERLASRLPPELADNRALAAAYFAQTAAMSHGSRQVRLRRAAAGYDQVAAAMQQLAAAMPVHDKVEDLTPSDRSRLEQIGQARPLIRRARDGERQALAALAELSDRPPLPPVQDDPLARASRGVRLFTWRAVTDETVYDLILSGTQLQVELRQGEPATSMSSEVYAAMPQKDGWRAVVSPGPGGTGVYQVVKQPDAQGGWRLLVRADDTWAWGQANAPELTVWAVPAP
jgi:uncharacterized protein (DUF362 family)